MWHPWKRSQQHAADLASKEAEILKLLEELKNFGLAFSQQNVLHTNSLRALQDVHSTALADLKAKHQQVEELLTRQVDYYRKNFEASVDRLLWEKLGHPLFHQVPEQTPVAPAADEEEEPPRGAVLGNARRFVNQATRASHAAARQKEHRSAPTEIMAQIKREAEAIRAVEKQGAEYAAQIPVTAEVSGT